MGDAAEHTQAAKRSRSESDSNYNTTSNQQPSSRLIMTGDDTEPDSDFGSDFDDGSDFDHGSESDVSEMDYAPADGNDDAPSITCMKQDSLNTLIFDPVAKLSDFAGLSEDNSIAVLHHVNWNVEDAIAKAIEDVDSLAQKAGFSLESDVFPVPEGSECSICMEDEGVVLRAIGVCGHIVCEDCFKTYILDKIETGSAHISCPGTSCHYGVKHSVILSMLDPMTEKRYWTLLQESVVTGNRNLVWCPTPECVTVISAESASEIRGSVECTTCKNKFCFDCGIEHAPATCENMKEFRKLQAVDGGNFLWLVNNAKECPKCAAFIEKNGGCNWIRCFKCKFEFCWLCGRHMLHSEVDVAGGSHRCNVFKEGEEQELKAREKGRQSIKEQDERRKFAHYHSRHQAHEQSAKLEEALLARHSKQDQALKGDATKQLFETQRDGLIQLRAARRTLCSSYIFGFYQQWEKGTSLKEVFEDLQHLLENRTEALSRAIEKSIMPPAQLENVPDDKILNDFKDEVLSTCAAVRTNQRNLIAATTTSTTSYSTEPQPS